MMIKKIKKRDGTIVSFDKKKISEAIWKAARSVGGKDKATSEKLAEQVVELLEKSLKEGEIPTVEQVQDIVEKILVENGHYQTAKAYITYRKEKERIRKEKIALLGKFYDEKVAKRFSINAIKLMVNRYLLKNEKREIIEGPKQLFQRVAMLIVIPDILYNKDVYDKEGKQEIKPKEEFNPEEWEGKLGFEIDGEFISWNKYHLERIKYLYDELNEKGYMKITWSDLLELLKNNEFQDYSKNFLRYFNLMIDKKFIPNSPTLFNAGAPLGQLSACFVIDMDDDMENIMDAAKHAAMIFKSGGGIGINYSKLRPEGDVVASTGGVASGPVSFMRIIDVVTDVVKQGGKRRGANMGILESWHPDIYTFIHAKGKEGVLENFNISVMVDDKFWEAYKEKKPYHLINPRNDEIVGETDSEKLLNEIAYMAWKTADPGVLFLDNINARNVQREKRGFIRATNPCGEQPLYPYESCNLGSINLYAFVKFDDKADPYFDWDEFREATKIAYRFLDNVIDVNKYPIPQIEKASKAVRRVGLGFMGLADTLCAMGIPYSSEEGFDFTRKVSEWLTYYSMEESVERGKERGLFDLYELSSYSKGEMPIEGVYHKELWTLDWEKLQKDIMKYGIRNVEVTSIAPTGSISMFFDVSSGIEPQFALVYEKRVVAGQFFYTDLEFERQLKTHGLYNDEILKKVSDNGGSVQGIEEIPEKLRRIFVTSLDIPWWDHIRAEAVSQLWITTSISKTINMPEWVTEDDVKKAYMVAHAMGCKGVTIYREKSKSKQVIYLPGEISKKRIKETLKLIKNKTPELIKELGIEMPEWYKNIENGEKIFSKVMEEEDVEKCPVCGSTNLVHQGGCITCLDCGWSECVIA
ncbi:MAG: adenosylcobalamin-dependent ribonucleoside-diphosphate reductase [Candidatus Aenigmarchaeota archaeon]|nr:adenosylcobalamin-dependent ribonucleoside-diphosphate reductase [Candidatus Aenigmarchaeota archaeon]